MPFDPLGTRTSTSSSAQIVTGQLVAPQRYPTLNAGASGIAFVEAAINSSASGSWVSIDQ